MSYILDALRKSEAERNHDVVPGLFTVGTPTSRTRSIVTVALIVVLVVNALLMAAWLSGWRLTFETESTANSEPAIGAMPLAPTQQQSVPPLRTMSPTAPPATPEPIPAQINEEPVPSTFEFSTHVYSSDPALRAVTLEGRRFQEGDTIAPDVRLVEITETGVVLDYRGARMDIDVLQDWR